MAHFSFPGTVLILSAASASLATDMSLDGSFSISRFFLDHRIRRLKLLFRRLRTHLLRFAQLGLTTRKFVNLLPSAVQVCILFT